MLLVYRFLEAFLEVDYVKFILDGVIDALDKIPLINGSGKCDGPGPGDELRAEGNGPGTGGVLYELVDKTLAVPGILWIVERAVAGECAIKVIALECARDDGRLIGEENTHRRKPETLIGAGVFMVVKEASKIVDHAL